MDEKDQHIEWLPLVDNSGEIISKATRQDCHSNKDLLHPVVHLHVFNKKKELFLQKRPLSKIIQPGKWDTAVGGHVDWGENIETALQRETSEEINLTSFSYEFVNKYVWESDVERELVYVYITTIDGQIEINSAELSDGKFWKIKNIMENIGQGVFTPNFEHEFDLLLI